MLPQIDGLPDTQREATLQYRYSQTGLRQRSTDMGRHVIGTLRAVGVTTGFRHECRHKAAEVAQDVGIGIFLNDETGTRMGHVNRAEAFPDKTLGHNTVDHLR